jgi:hypothetical protein
LEYYLPSEVKEVGVISVASVVHGYRYILLSDDSVQYAGYGESGNCQVNINCSEGQTWQQEKNAVAMILVNGERVCTGSLINTTANDNRPLFLTADHCLVDGSDAITSPNLNHWSFYWHYESPGCGNYSSSARSTVGAMVVANNDISDFALLQLSENPALKAGIVPYYLGWDRSGNAGTGGVGIHHPMGDIKKISTYTATPINSTCRNVNFWDIGFAQTTHGFSVMQPGSSGSPLINSSRKVIGQLLGPWNCPNIQCDNPSEQRVAYGKFSVSWDGNGTTDNRRRLRDWLDPAGTNPQTLDGTVSPTIIGPTEICAERDQYFEVINAPTNFTWESSYNLTKISSGSNTACFSVTGYSDAAWVSIHLNGMEMARHYVDIVFDAPVVEEITGPENISTYGFYTAVFSSISPATYCDWATYNSHAQVNGNGYSYIYINYSDYYPSAFSLLLIATNACGEGLGYKGISATGYGSSYVSSYPNPVSDILQIEIDRQAIARVEALRQTTTDGKSLKIDPTYDIRLYDGQGNLLRRTATKGGKVEFNVAGLTAGIYYLHIYDGTGNKPEVRQIVVQH